MPELSIPVIDVAALFDGPSPARDRSDAAIMEAASTFGFFAACALPEDVPIDRETRSQLLRLFELPQDKIRPLWRQKFDASHANVYRGWFPLQTGYLTSKEGIDLGADVAYGTAVVRIDDPLREATPLPPESDLPGWRASAARYYRAMEWVAGTLMQAIARGLGLEERFFDHAFERGLSTLRLIRYPVRTDLDQAAIANPELWIEHRGRRFYVTGTPHQDTGFLTLLAQDGVAGLQAQHRSREWLDVPPAEGLLAVNFGEILERLSAGRIKATRHRVIGYGSERKSIPFFYEPRADAEFRPLPLGWADDFEPFFYGDFLWATTTKFVEFKGLEGLRKPLRPQKAIRPQIHLRSQKHRRD
jgi:isopenicillin N synthase-like dioxygenase